VILSIDNSDLEYSISLGTPVKLRLKMLLKENSAFLIASLDVKEFL
jgi:hypothetical protein